MDNCALLDGRPAVTVVAGFSICQHHVDVLAEIKAQAEARTRKYLAPPALPTRPKRRAKKKRATVRGAHRATGRKVGRPPSDRRATCHPDRAHHAKGLCHRCYNALSKRKARAA